MAEMISPMTEREMAELFAATISTKPATGLMYVGNVSLAMVQAGAKWEGANWRRFKREINKAAKRARNGKPPLEANAST